MDLERCIQFKRFLYEDDITWTDYLATIGGPYQNSGNSFAPVVFFADIQS